MWTGALVTATAVWTIFRYGLHNHSDVIHGSGWFLPWTRALLRCAAWRSFLRWVSQAARCRPPACRYARSFVSSARSSVRESRPLRGAQVDVGDAFGLSAEPSRSDLAAADEHVHHPPARHVRRALVVGEVDAHHAPPAPVGRLLLVNHRVVTRAARDVVVPRVVLALGASGELFLCLSGVSHVRSLSTPRARPLAGYGL